MRGCQDNRWSWPPSCAARVLVFVWATHFGCQDARYSLGALPEGGTVTGVDVSTTGSEQATETGGVGSVDAEETQASESGAGSESVGDPSVEPPPARVVHSFAAAEALPMVTQASSGQVTASYQPPIVPMVIDWDADGDEDLVVVGGAGGVWLHERRAGGFAAATEILDGALPLNLGASSRSFIIGDFDQDQLFDLLSLDEGGRLRLFTNRGESAAPRFLGHQTGAHSLPAGTLPFAAAVDWDDDGSMDLISGSMARGLQVWRGAGLEFSALPAMFDVGVEAEATTSVRDLDRDGEVDLLVVDDSGRAKLARRLASTGSLRWDLVLPLRGDDGYRLELESRLGVRPRAVLLDVDGDQVADLVAGDATGQLRVFPGVDYLTALASIEDSFRDHGPDLSTHLAAADSFRNQLFGNLVSLREALAHGLLTREEAQAIDVRAAALVRDYPQWLQQRSFDLSTEAHLPQLAAQLWVLLLELRMGDRRARVELADLLDFEPPYRELLVEWSLLYLDNRQASTAQLNAVLDVLAEIPSGLYDADVLAVHSWLGPSDDHPRLSARGIVPMFSTAVGSAENIFPSDAPPGIIDVFSAAFIHELNHFTLETVGRRTRPDVFERSFELLLRALGPDFAFSTPVRHGPDWPAIKARFLAENHWNGVEDDWSAAYERYFSEGPGAELQYQVPRGDPQLLVQLPYESFATLSGQYFCDSQRMLELCLDRFDRGYRVSLDYFLLVVDVYSAGGNMGHFYTVDVDAQVGHEPVVLERDGDQRITVLETAAGRYSFERDAEGWVQGWARLEIRN